MVSNTKEIALEQTIQKHLTGFTSEELAGQPQPKDAAKYRIGSPLDFNAQYALDTKLFWQFLEDTQGKELEKLRTRNPSDWERKIFERFDRIALPPGFGDEFDNSLVAPSPRGTTDTLTTHIRQGTVFPARDGYLLTARGNPYGNVVRDGNRVVVHTAGGKDVTLKPLKLLAAERELEDPEVGCGERVRYRLLVTDADRLVSEFSQPLEVVGEDIQVRVEWSPEGVVLRWAEDA